MSSSDGTVGSAAAGDAHAQFAAALRRTFEAPAPGRARGGARFRGVTRHKRTQRFEAHIWESKKQVYLGGFDREEDAAKSHDIMALRCAEAPAPAPGGGGAEAPPKPLALNFPAAAYAELRPALGALSRDAVVAALRSYSKAAAPRRAGGPGGGARAAAAGVRKARPPAPSGGRGGSPAAPPPSRAAGATPFAAYAGGGKWAPPALRVRLAPRPPPAWAPPPAAGPLGPRRARLPSPDAAPPPRAAAAAARRRFNDLDSLLDEMEDQSLTFSPSEDCYLYESSATPPGAGGGGGGPAAAAAACACGAAGAEPGLPQGQVAVEHLNGCQLLLARGAGSMRPRSPGPGSGLECWASAGRDLPLRALGAADGAGATPPLGAFEAAAVLDCAL